MQIETVAASWDTYRAAVVPPDASEEQIAATRAAFYAGAYFLLMGSLYNIGDDSTSEDEGVAQLEAIKQEIETFATSFGARLPGEAALSAPAADAVPEVAYTTTDPENVRPVLQDLGGRIAHALPPGWGYNLLLFPFGEPTKDGGVFYISNAERATVLELMREFLRRAVQ